MSGNVDFQIVNEASNDEPLIRVSASEILDVKMTHKSPIRISASDVVDAIVNDPSIEDVLFSNRV